MSGGVDSSTVLGLLKEQGHEVVGLTLKILPCEITPGENGAVSVKTVEPKGQRCCSVEDIQDARNVALKLGAPHYVNEGLDVFRAKVVDRFLDEYEQGLTPNPCVECNRFAKLPLLLKQALSLGCEKLATGHYARLDQDPNTGRWRIRKAADPDKDQSYVLYKLSQKLIGTSALPLGGDHQNPGAGKGPDPGLEYRRKTREHGNLFRHPKKLPGFREDPPAPGFCARRHRGRGREGSGAP